MASEQRANRTSIALKSGPRRISHSVRLPQDSQCVRLLKPKRGDSYRHNVYTTPLRVDQDHQAVRCQVHICEPAAGNPYHFLSGMPQWGGKERLQTWVLVRTTGDVQAHDEEEHA